MQAHAHPLSRARSLLSFLFADDALSAHWYARPSLPPDCGIAVRGGIQPCRGTGRPISEIIRPAVRCVFTNPSHKQPTHVKRRNTYVYVNIYTYIYMYIYILI